MSVETLGVVVVPALALLLYYLMPSPEDPPAEGTESDEPPPGPTPRTQPARTQRRATMHRPAFIGAGALFLGDAFDRVHGRVHRFRSQHGAVFAVVALALLLALVVGGLALANLASAGPNVVNANVATHYVNLPGEDGKQAKVLMETVTIPGKGKVVRVRMIVTKEHTTTTRLPGQTVSVKGPTHTVTVAGPTKTVTETVTQTETVTETVEVTTTVGGGPGPP